jgi:hypothetical protein
MPKKINLNEDLNLGNDLGEDFDLDMGEGAFSLDDDEMPSPVAGVNYTGRVQDDAVAEAEAVMSAFQKRAADEAHRFREATDSEFWCCFCFQTREQKEEFLRAFNLLSLGDKYLDGPKAARRMGKPVQPANVQYRDGRIDPKLAKLAR